MISVGALQPDEQLESEIRRIGHLPEKIETAAPEGEQPGENGQGADEMESKSIYKITSILDKYQTGKTTRAAAARLLESLGLDDEQTEFYRKEADIGRKNAAKLKAEEDAQDAKEAEEAKKSLQRRDEQEGKE